MKPGYSPELGHLPLPEDDRPFVGRDGELARLLTAWTGAVRGRGSMFVVSGEAGIGKTRLTEELARRVAADGGTFAAGRCHEQAGAPAYWPWLQVARQLEDPSRLERLLSQTADETTQASPGHARFPIYEAIVGQLTAAAHVRPTVVVVDDLQWADVASLGVLDLISGAVRNTPLLVIATFRDTEVGPDHPLAAALARLARQPGVERVALEGLPPAAVGLYVSAATGRHLGSATNDALWARTDGNPFYLAELVRLLASEGHIDALSAAPESQVPEGVRDVLRRRLNRLPEDVQTVLSVAAVVGRDFEAGVLADACEQSEDSVLNILDTALTTRLLTADFQRGQQFRFTHALVRDTLYDGMTPVRRARLHARVADAVERRAALLGEESVFALAHHFSRAAPVRGQAKALEYTCRAAAVAYRQRAYEQAAGLWRVAVDATPVDRQRLELLDSLGHAYRMAGDVNASVRTYADAAELAEALDDPRAMAAAVVAM